MPMAWVGQALVNVDGSPSHEVRHDRGDIGHHHQTDTEHGQPSAPAASVWIMLLALHMLVPAVDRLQGFDRPAEASLVASGLACPLATANPRLFTVVAGVASGA